MSMNINPSLVKLKQETVSLQPASVSQSDSDVAPVVLSTASSVSPDDMLGLMATQSVTNGVTINTDKQNQAKLDNARAALSAAHEALQNNTDPTKTEELQKAVDEALENYQKVVKELADAGFLETKLTVEETPATRAEGGNRVETEEIYENGKLTLKTEITYDANGNLVQTVKTTYEYDEINGDTTTVEVYDSENKLLTREINDFYSDGSIRVKEFIEYYYNANGTEIGYRWESNGGASDSSKMVIESGCDKDGNPLIGLDGQEIAYRRMNYDADGNLCGRGINDSSGWILAYNPKRIVDDAILERDFGGVEKYYDTQGRIIAKCAYTDTYDIRETTLYYYDESGNVVKEEFFLVDYPAHKTLSSKVSEYEYNKDGSYTKTTTQSDNSDGTKIIVRVEVDSDGNIVHTRVEYYDSEGEILKSISANGEITDEQIDNANPNRPEDPVDPDPVDPDPVNPDPVDPTPTPPETEVPKDVDISDQDATKLLSGLSSSMSLTGWVRSGAKNPRGAVAAAISSMMTQIGSIASKLKVMGYDSAKVDSAATTLKNYYTALLNTVYDDDNKLQKKGETCATRFTYRDASGKVQSGSSNFRHYAFGLEKNANEKVGAGSESASGIVLLENTGINHSYRIAVDMKTVANMLIEFFNAL